MATPIPYEAAALRLGHTRATAHHARLHIRTWQKAHPNHASAYQQALHHIARTIETLPDPINYEHRRTRLRSWTMPATVWHHLSARAATDRPTNPAAATAVVWAELTGSDLRLAPILHTTALA
ncbi:hypothetical protein [Streptomyces palmae]|uniref:Uncharacterized protein n=1 Tax=Streptomyces palmae TaxID=1701085 RepID=A0A4Z0HDA3_9ACTN|nr:hypothetical protein [Streptomyces palmae]TGB15571.1 hypothetical protein E4099_06685 [Streptomyces palmae]